MKSITATSLKDGARIAGLVLPAGHVVTVDLSEEQMGEVQAAIDRGDVAVDGMSASKPAPAPAQKSKGK